MHLVGQNEGCGDDLTSSSGVIASIDDDSNGMYDNSLDCLWTVRLSTDQVIIFKFREMDIHTRSPICEVDYLEVRPTFKIGYSNAVAYMYMTITHQSAIS